MTNDVHIKITADKADTTGIRQADQDVTKLKRSAKEASPAVDELIRSAGNAGKGFSDTDKHLTGLNDSIAISKDKLESLAHSFAQTDDAAQKIDIKKAMDRVQRDISSATKAKKLIIEAEPHAEPSKLRAFGDNIANAARQAASSMPTILGAGIAAAAPLVGSAMAGAIIGGAGLGGVIGGIMLVKDDPKVIGAAQGLASRVGDRLKLAASPFVDTTVKGLATIEGSLNRIDFEGIFKKASTFVQPLATAAGHVAEDLGAGFGALIQVADPVIKSISHGLEGIGQAAEDGMKSLTDNADTAASSLDTLFDTVKNGVAGTFALINGLTELKAKFDGAADGMFAFDSGLKIINAALPHGNGSRWVDPIEAFNDAVAHGTTTLDVYGQEITSAGASLGDLAAQTIAADNATRGLFDAATSIGEAEDALTESIKKNGKSLDAHTEKGRANRTALSHLAAAYNDVYEKTVATSGAGREADAVANKNYASFIKAARGLGISGKAAADYANQLGLIPPKKDTKINANTHDAAGRIAALQGQINALRGKTVVIRTVITGGSLAGGIHVSGPGGSGTLTKASGGIAGRSADGSTPNGLTWVGEGGPELMDLPAGRRIWSAGDSARMANDHGGGGPKTITVNLVVDKRVLASAVVEPLRENIRTLAGGSAQTYWGQERT